MTRNCWPSSSASAALRLFAQIRWQLENPAPARCERVGGGAALGKHPQELKQLFIGRHNRRRGRRGTLWEEHFKSVLMVSSEVA